MSKIALFEAFEDQDIRWNIDLNKPWWFAKNVCAALAIANPGGLEGDGRYDLGIPSAIGKLQKLIIINKAELCRLVFRSRTESAKLSQNWMFQEVLPTIQKTGSFDAQAQPSTLPERVTELALKFK